MSEPESEPKRNVRLILLGAVLIALTAGLAFQLWSAFDGARRKRNERAIRIAAAQRQQAQGGVAVESLLESAAEARLATARSASSSVGAKRLAKHSWKFWDESLPTPETIRTEATIAEEYERFRLRELEAYRARTKDQGPARVAGEEFLDAFLRGMAAGSFGRHPDSQRLRTLANAAIAAGSRDPMVRIHHAELQWEGGRDREECRMLLTEALRDLADSGYPKIVASYGRLYLRDFTPVEDSDRRNAVLQEALPAFIAWLEEEAADPAWTRCAMRRVSTLYKFWPAADRRLLLLALVDAPKIDPYIPHVLLGDLFVEKAWNRRGGGWAVEVRPEQWAGFEKYMGMASDHLQYAWSLRPDLPDAPARMIPVAMAGYGGGRPSGLELLPIPVVGTSHAIGEGTRFWFLRTIEALYDEESAYRSYLYSLTTRWGGRNGQILSAGRLSLETDRFDTRIPYMALEALDVHRDYELEEDETLADAPEAVDLLRAFLARRKKAIADRGMNALREADGSYRGLLLQLLESAGLQEEAAQLLVEVGNDLNWIAQRRDNRPGRYLAARLVAEAAGDAAAIAAFDAALRGPLTPAANPAESAALEAEWQKLRASASAQAGPHDYFQHTEAMLAQRREYMAGNWVTLRPEFPLWGWEPYADRWFADPAEGVTLSARYGDSPLLCLRPLIGLQPPLEAEAVVVIQDPAPYPGPVGIGWSREGDYRVFGRNPGLSLFAVEASLAMRHPERRMARRDMGFVLYLNGQSPFFPLAAGAPHRIRIKTWGTEVEFQVDDLGRSAPLPAGLDPQGWLAFGAIRPRYDQETRLRMTGAVTLRDVRFRRLDVALPPAAGTPLGERRRYWSERKGWDPADLIAAVNVARLDLEGGEFEAALAGTDAIRRQWPRANGIAAIRGAALMERRRYEEALRELDAAGYEWEDDPEADGRRAEILSAAPQDALRDPKRGLSLGQHAYRIRRTPRTCAALAAGHAANGQFKEAVEFQEEAVRIAPAALAEDFRSRLALYREGQPYRLPESEM